MYEEKSQLDKHVNSLHVVLIFRANGPNPFQVKFHSLIDQNFPWRPFLAILSAANNSLYLRGKFLKFRGVSRRWSAFRNLRSNGLYWPRSFSEARARFCGIRTRHSDEDLPNSDTLYANESSTQCTIYSEFVMIFTFSCEIN